MSLEFWANRVNVSCDIAIMATIFRILRKDSKTNIITEFEKGDIDGDNVKSVD
jgi:hypothetical protein